MQYWEEESSVLDDEGELVKVQTHHNKQVGKYDQTNNHTQYHKKDIKSE